MRERKRQRLQNWDYAENGYYFVTICTKDRRNYLGSIVGNRHACSPAGVIAEQNLLEIPKHYPYITIDKYVIMPNHIHAIIVIEPAGTERACPFPTG